MITTLEEKLGVKFPPGDQLHTDETNKWLKDLCKKHNVDCSEPRTNASCSIRSASFIIISISDILTFAGSSLESSSNLFVYLLRLSWATPR